MKERRLLSLYSVSNCNSLLNPCIGQMLTEFRGRLEWKDMTLIYRVSEFHII